MLQNVLLSPRAQSDLDHIHGDTQRLNLLSALVRLSKEPTFGIPLKGVFARYQALTVDQHTLLFEQKKAHIVVCACIEKK